MTTRSGPTELDFEAFGLAVGSAVISGALSLALPFLAALTGSLAALAVAGWIARQRHRGVPRSELRRARVVGAGALLVLAIVLYVAPPVSLEPGRGLALGLGLVPLWIVERRRSGGAASTEVRR